MTNPARALLDILRAWEPEGRETFAAARGVTSDEESAWRTHATAVELVVQIDRRLSAIEALTSVSVDAYRRQLPALCRTIFAPDIPWKSGPPGNSQRWNWLSQAQVDSLEMLGSFLDSYREDDILDGQTVSDLLALLDETEQLVHELEELPRSERLFILGLIREAQAVLKDVDRYGESSPRKVMFELIGHLTVAVPQTTGAHRERLVEKLKRWFGVTESGAKAVSAVSESLSQIMPPPG